METALDKIIARKRIEVEKAKAATSLDTLKERTREVGRPRNFFAAVINQRPRRTTRIIAEIKKRSPSAGLIRSDFDVADIAKQYHDAGAAAISCLTDEEDFDGHLGYIHRIRDVVPLPVLRKDFIVDEYQIWESRAAGADAVLLIADVLEEAELVDMAILAHELKMTTLIEAHDLDRLLKIHQYVGFPHAGYSLLGINNRDLKTMKTDITHTYRMLEFIEDRKIVVSESGITSATDLAKLRQRGVNIVLVGEYLLRQEHPGNALRELLGQSIDENA